MTQDFLVSSDIYSLESIQEAIRAFSDVSEILYKNDSLSISWDSQQDITDIFNEFMNYVLSI